MAVSTGAPRCKHWPCQHRAGLGTDRCDELLGYTGRVAVVVLQIDEGLLPWLGADLLCPLAEASAGIFAPAKAHVPPPRRGHERRFQRLALGYAQSGSLVTERCPHVFIEPRWMTKLERDLQVAWHVPKKLGQARDVFAKKGRELKEKRSKARSERARDSHEHVERVGCILQLCDVRDALRCLHPEDESVGHLTAPTFDELACVHAIKSVVDLHRGQVLRVEAQKLGGGKILRIKGPLPLFVRVPTCAN